VSEKSTRSDRMRLAAEALARAEKLAERSARASYGPAVYETENGYQWFQPNLFIAELADYVSRLARTLKEALTENEELRQELGSYRALLLEESLAEIHDAKKGPMTIEDARAYLRKLSDDAQRGHGREER
jgi:hypothetical protein